MQITGSNKFVMRVVCCLWCWRAVLSCCAVVVGFVFWCVLVVLECLWYFGFWCFGIVLCCVKLYCVLLYCATGLWCGVLCWCVFVLVFWSFVCLCLFVVLVLLFSLYLL